MSSLSLDSVSAVKVTLWTKPEGHKDTMEDTDSAAKDKEARGEKRHRCEECGKSFRQKPTLTQHQRLHTGENLLYCPMCSKKCTTKTQLIHHVRVHTGEKPFTCDQCGKAFGLKANLKAHELLHIRERQFTCDQCGASFKDPNKLLQHSVVHTENRDSRKSFLDKTQPPRTLPQQPAAAGFNKQLPRALKLNMIDAHKTGDGYKKISKQFGIPVSSVRNVIRKWKVTGTVEVKPRSGRPRKISETAACSIAGKAMENPCLSARSLQEDLADTGIVVHRSTVKRYLYKYGLRGRDVRRKPLPENSPQESEAEVCEGTDLR